MIYKIAQNLKWPCRVIDVKLKTNRANGSKFVVAKLGKYDTDEFLRSVIMNEHKYDFLLSEMKIRKYHTIERITLRPQNNVYHILQWDDIDRGTCTREHIDEIQRDNEGKPILFNQIVVFANLDNTNRFTVNEVLDKEYIEVNSPIVQSYLNFNNQQYFLKQQEERRKLREADYDQMMGGFHDAYEEKANMDMSEEERVMSALENGNGELCGF